MRYTFLSCLVKISRIQKFPSLFFELRLNREARNESKFGHLDEYIYFSTPKSTIFVTGKGRG